MKITVPTTWSSRRSKYVKCSKDSSNIQMSAISENFSLGLSKCKLWTCEQIHAEQYMYPEVCPRCALIYSRLILHTPILQAQLFKLPAIVKPQITQWSETISTQRDPSKVWSSSRKNNYHPNEAKVRWTS